MNFSKIETLDQLEQFTKNKKLFDKNIILNFETIDDQRNVYYAKLINENKNACGCETGTAFMIISILITFFLIISNYQVFKTHYFLNVVYGFILVFVFSMLGKLIGLGVAKYRLKKALKEIKNIVQNDSVYYQTG